MLMKFRLHWFERKEIPDIESFLCELLKVIQTGERCEWTNNKALSRCPFRAFQKHQQSFLFKSSFSFSKENNPNGTEMNSSGMVIFLGIEWMISLGIWLNIQTKSISVYLGRVQLIVSVNLNKIRVEGGLCFIVLFVESKLFPRVLPVKSCLLRRALHQ